mgnify:CR=1 FL=1
MIVDDNENNLYTLNALIRKYMDVEVLQASSGKEAIDIALRDPRIDLIVLDVQMPEMDGFEATAAIRRAEQIAGGHVPIVAMTASAMKGDRERCLTAGMDGYLTKPVRAKELYEVVESFASSPAAAAKGG